VICTYRLINQRSALSPLSADTLEGIASDEATRENEAAALEWSPNRLWEMIRAVLTVS